MLSDTAGFGAASSAVIALVVQVYEIAFVAPAGIRMVPLSALAPASGRSSVDINVQAARAVPCSRTVTVDPVAVGMLVPGMIGFPVTTGAGALWGQLADGRAFREGGR